MGRGTCGAEEQDQVGTSYVCPKGWPDVTLLGRDRVGVPTRDHHNGGVAGVSSTCWLCSFYWSYPFTEEERARLEAVAPRQ